MYDFYFGIMFHIVLCVTAVLVFLYWWKFKWVQRKVMAAASKWPCPPWLPVLGNAHMALGGIEKVSEMMNGLSVKYGGLTCYWLGPVPLFVVSEPDALKIILNSSKALEKDDGYMFLKPFLGNGLITAPAQTWKKNRRVLNPVFSPKNIESFIETFNHINNKLVKRLQVNVGKEETNIYSNVLATAAELVCRYFNQLSQVIRELIFDRTVLGLYVVDFESRIPKYHSNLMTRVARLLILRFNKPWLAIDSIFNFIHGKDMKEINIIIDDLISELTEELRNNRRMKNDKDKTGFGDINKNAGPEDSDAKTDEKNFVNILMELIEADPTFTKEDMKYEILTTLAPKLHFISFLELLPYFEQLALDALTRLNVNHTSSCKVVLTGSDSYSATLCFCLLCLANDQDVQNKLFKEIESVFQNSSRNVTLEDINKLPYLDCIIKETFRRISIIPFVARRATEDIKLSSSYSIPAGGRVIININGLHMNPALYPEPEKFNPDRFSQERVIERHSYSHLPFSGGPRNCIAKTYSMIGLKVSVIQLIRKFRFTTSLHLKDVIFQIQISKGSKNGYPLKIHSRGIM